ncbi:hypothetical protein BU16DRAFT_543466 [Lophium mytilinum]|uniref:RING-type domain-containing protein n=1 Tax=Lophium mytilinum TaxID=390894 RepID=A0A6A6QGH3_9PEZI|nr:hypothetical protein BU16DRAFT_543466 [Lophium mytilinum]
MNPRAESSPALELLTQQTRIPGRAFIVTRTLTSRALSVRNRELPGEDDRGMFLHYLGSAGLLIEKYADIRVEFTMERVVSTGPGEPSIRMTRQPGSAMSDPVIIAHDNPHTVDSLIFHGWILDPEAQLGAYPVYKWGHMRVILVTGNPTVVFQYRDTAVMIVVSPEDRIQLRETISLPVPGTQNTRDVSLEWTREIKVDDFATELDQCAICYQDWDKDHRPYRVPCGHVYGKNFVTDSMDSELKECRLLFLCIHLPTMSSNMSESPGHIMMSDSHGTQNVALPDVRDGRVGFQTKRVLDNAITVRRAPRRPQQVWVFIRKDVTARLWFGEPPVTPLNGVDLLTTKVKLARGDKDVGFAQSDTEEMRALLEHTWVGSNEVFHITPSRAHGNDYLNVVYAKGNPTLVLEHKGRNMIVIAGLEDHLLIHCVDKEGNEPTQQAELFKRVDDCAICLEHYDEDHVAVRLRCGHYFGEKCILAVIGHPSSASGARCPNCRAWIQG